MIPIPYAHIFSVYLCIWIVILAVLWIRHEIRQYASRDWTGVKNRLYLCRNCHLSFMAPHRSGNIIRCPRCNEMCFLNLRKR